MKSKIALCLAGFLIFFFMGSEMISLYSLWDDEANTALFAQTVKTTGDTSAQFHQNLIAYRNGAELNENLKARYVSPLQYYFSAPFVQSENPSSARQPFFILTLLAFALILYRMVAMRLSHRLLGGFILLSFGLTSFLLFGVQARYYALTLLLSVWAMDLYLFQKLSRRRTLFLFGLSTSLLFISNYLVGVAFLTAIGAHFLIFRCSEFNEVIRRSYLFFISHLVISIPVFSIWNPLGKHVVEVSNTPLDRFKLLFRSLRDFNGGAMGSVLLLILGLFIFSSLTVKRRFRQYALVFFAYVFVIALFSPQPIQGTVVADIRYLYPLMVLAFAWTLDFWNTLAQQKGKVIYWVGLTFFSLSSLPYSGQLRFPFYDLIREINHPADDPYQVVGSWLKNNVKAPATVVSSLDYAIYPLMFIAPDFRYQGQLKSETDAHQAEYLVSFCDDAAVSKMKEPSLYKPVAEFKMACREAYRPELFLRSFGQNQSVGKVQIFSRINAEK